MRIIFMGTPDFAVQSLAKLVEGGCEVVAVITATDKAAGRGKKLRPSPVKQYAIEKNIPVLQPKNLKAASFLEELKSYKADLQVVVAFRMLPAVVFEMPPLGTFNLHASLLPQYRGAAPINWAVINGETETGVTTFFIEQQIDTGLMIFQEKTIITPNMTAGELHDQLMIQGANLVLKTVEAIKSGEYPQIKQTEINQLKSAPKIFKEDCKIDWQKPMEEVHNFIRGLSPYPAAFTFINEKRFKVFKTSKIPLFATDNPGKWETDNESFLHFHTTDGLIAIEELQMEGKKRMTIKDFLRGYNLTS